MTRRRFYARLLLLVLALVPRHTGAQPPAPARPIVILISLDGWRWDYLDRYRAPAIAQLAASGVRSEGLIPVFPSKTFPNHYTIVTGLYPARHGIVSNNMIDPALPGRFSLSASTRSVQQDTRWWGGEPIWVTAERQGLVAGTMFWPGSDVEIAGDRPTFFRMFDDDFPNDARVDELLIWLGQPERWRPTFLTLYFSDVDSAGHDGGPESEETRQAVARLDAAVARLVAGLARLGLTDRTNLILVSDHGMAATSRERTIVLDDYIDMSTVDLIDSSPVLGLNPLSESADALAARLRNTHPALQVFTRDTLPDKYRLRGHPRMPAVIGIADDGWDITTRAALAVTSEGSGGNHGYDPRYRSMHGLFIATGPRFKSGLVVPPFENVHVYALMCRVLGIEPAPNDGDLAVTASVLR